LSGAGKGQITLTAFLNVEFRKFEFVGHEFQHRAAGKIGNRENRFENCLQTFV
jgi:hypothetical protein